MKFKFAVSALAIAVSAGSAFAADLPSTKAPAAAPVIASPWDWDIGAGLTTNYIFRGITQSNGGPSVSAHGEVRYNVNDTWQLYIGTSAESIKFSPNYYSVGSPALELDGDAGVRGTFDKFGFDLGAIVYGYPDSPTGTKLVQYTTPVLGLPVVGVGGLAPRNPTFVEIYFKPTYTVNDMLTVGANFFYSPSYLNTGANSEYLSGTAKVTLPGNFSAFSLSGELGYQWFSSSVDSIYSGGYGGTTSFAYIAGGAVNGVGNYENGKLPDYLYYNVGGSYVWRFVTLDLRFYGTNLSKTAAYQLTGIPNSSTVGTTQSKYGQNAIVGTISFDLTSKDLK